MVLLGGRGAGSWLAPGEAVGPRQANVVQRRSQASEACTKRPTCILGMVGSGTVPVKPRSFAPGKVRPGEDDGPQRGSVR